MIKTKKLNSGIRLVMEEVPYVQSIAIGIWVRAGAVDENEEHAGISHFIEHMMFKGTLERSAKQIAEDIDKIGGQINAFTGKEATCYYVKAIYNNYKAAADVLVDMLSNSKLETEEMDKERQVICEEIKMTLDTPDDLAHESIVSVVFQGNPLGKSIIGTPASLDMINHNVMAEYLKKEYTKDNLVISIAGKFDEEEISEYFEEKFSVLLDKKPVKENVYKAYKPGYKSIVKDIEQSHICLATRGLSLLDKDYFSFSILNNIMGGSMSSRLFQDIREEKGLAYSVFSMMGSFRNDGYFNIYAGVSHDKIEAAINGIKDELKELSVEGVTKEELESSREQLKSAYIFSQENVSSRMFKNGKNALLCDKTFTPEEIIGSFDAVSMEDVEDVKSMICNFDSYCAVVVGSEEHDLEKIVKG